MNPQTLRFSDVSDDAGTAENRTAPRHDYRYVQAVAPLRNGTMPTAEDFFNVDCCDLSRGGVAFYLDTPPDFDELVVVLGRGPLVKRCRAKVVHVGQLSVDGGARYRVGCRFTERLGL